jgi:hypothetical protein
VPEFGQAVDQARQIDVRQAPADDIKGRDQQDDSGQRQPAAQIAAAPALKVELRANGAVAVRVVIRHGECLIKRSGQGASSQAVR